ncbi:hypothetical protein Btru_054165 [Bulinus truncatus]|nr:hypothetical protein Btru_054165 [Bulinus truncatus]
MSDSTDNVMEDNDFQDADNRHCISHQTAVIIGVTLGIGCLGSFTALCLCYWTRPKSKLTSKFSLLYKRYFGFSFSKAAQLADAGRDEGMGHSVSPGESRQRVFYINEKVNMNSAIIHPSSRGRLHHVTQQCSSVDLKKTKKQDRVSPVLSVDSMVNSADGYVSLDDYSDRHGCRVRDDHHESAAGDVNQCVLGDVKTVSPYVDTCYPDVTGDKKTVSPYVDICYSGLSGDIQTVSPYVDICYSGVSGEIQTVSPYVDKCYSGVSGNMAPDNNNSSDDKSQDKLNDPDTLLTITLGILLSALCLLAIIGVILCYCKRRNVQFRSQFSVMYKRYFGFSISHAIRGNNPTRDRMVDNVTSDRDVIYVINETVIINSNVSHFPAKSNVSISPANDKISNSPTACILNHLTNHASHQQKENLTHLEDVSHIINTPVEYENINQMNLNPENVNQKSVNQDKALPLEQSSSNAESYVELYDYTMAIGPCQPYRTDKSGQELSFDNLSQLAGFRGHTNTIFSREDDRCLTSVPLVDSRTPLETQLSFTCKTCYAAPTVSGHNRQIEPQISAPEDPCSQLIPSNPLSRQEDWGHSDENGSDIDNYYYSQVKLYGKDDVDFTCDRVQTTDDTA